MGRKAGLVTAFLGLKRAVGRFWGRFFWLFSRPHLHHTRHFTGRNDRGPMGLFFSNYCTREIVPYPPLFATFFRAIVGEKPSH